MNLHIHSSHLGPYGIDARPIERRGLSGERVLDEVVVESVHPSGHGRVVLTPDQTLRLLARLTQIDVSLLHGALPVEFALKEATAAVDGETAWAVIRTTGQGTVECEEVVVADGAGIGVVHLAPEQVGELLQRLTALTLDYLHENVFGGEDARIQ
jgi:hypothetical protein